MGWVRTRYCYCDNCRFTKDEVCPETSNPERGKGKWLWVMTSTSSSDLDMSDKVYLRYQLKSQVIEDVGSGS